MGYDNVVDGWGSWVLCLLSVDERAGRSGDAYGSFLGSSYGALCLISEMKECVWVIW